MLPFSVSKMDKLINLLWFVFGGGDYFVAWKCFDSSVFNNLYLTYAHKCICEAKHMK